DGSGHLFAVILSSGLFSGHASDELPVSHRAVNQLGPPHVRGFGFRVYFESEIGQPGFRNLEAADIGRVKVKRGGFKPSLIHVLPPPEAQISYSVLFRELDA